MSPFSKRNRFCRPFAGATFFKPQGIPMHALEINDLELDELEAMHLCDYENLDQAEAATRMKISTSTLQRLLYSGRKKIADAIYSSKALRVTRHGYINEVSSSQRVFGRGKGFGNRGWGGRRRW